MAKRFLDDMVKVKNERRKKMTHHGILKNQKKVLPKKQIHKKEKIKRQTPQIPKKTKDNYYGLWFLAIISLIFLFFSFSTFFAKAYISIKPRTNSVILDEKLTAQKDLGVDNRDLSYQLVVEEDTQEAFIEKIGEEEVKEKASGIVVLYNNFNIKPQNLNENTRLKSTDGKIYKTEKKVTIPGRTLDGIPGSVEIKVYASEPGESYNSLPTDFTIVGFKGTSKYDKFYGRSKTELTGGFIGVKKVTDEKETEKVIKETEELLRASLIRKVVEQISSGYILFKDAIFFESSYELFDTNEDSENVNLKVFGTLYGFLFNEEELTDEIMYIKFPENKEEEVYLHNIKDLTFSLVDEDISFFNTKKIDFTLKGETIVISKIDEKDILRNLIGKPKKDFEYIFSRYNNIESADLKIKPTWEKDIPSKIKNINININYPK